MDLWNKTEDNDSGTRLRIRSVRVNNGLHITYSNRNVVYREFRTAQHCPRRDIDLCLSMMATPALEKLYPYLACTSWRNGTPVDASHIALDVWNEISARTRIVSLQKNRKTSPRLLSCEVSTVSLKGGPCVQKQFCRKARTSCKWKPNGIVSFRKLKAIQYLKVW